MYFEGDADDAATYLAKELGWAAELEDAIKMGNERLREKWEIKSDTGSAGEKSENEGVDAEGTVKKAAEEVAKAVNGDEPEDAAPSNPQILTGSESAPPMTEVKDPSATPGKLDAETGAGKL